MNIYGWHYKLSAAKSLNQKSQRNCVEGFLILHNGGYACVQAWEEFGHAPLQAQWDALASGHHTPLTRAALLCAQHDSLAREQEKSWWQQVNVPPSHTTLLDSTDCAAAYLAGFRIMKIKARIDDEILLETMRKFSDVKFRLDFNEVPSKNDFLTWAEKIPAEIKQQIDFCEDPFPYDEDAWHQTEKMCGLKFAVDRAETNSDKFLKIWKPAWQTEKPTGQIIVTSAMDHPIGQAWAAYQAGLHHITAPCGIRTDHLFSINDFSQEMGIMQPAWKNIQGTGMGWNDLLENIPWKKIS